MKFRLATLLVLSSIFSLFNTGNAQLEIKNISLGYKVFYIDGAGNNPTTIAPIMKEPASYQNFLNSFNYNGFTGSPGIQYLKTYYINTEIYKQGTDSRFWKKYTIQTGLLITNILVKKGLSVERRDYSSTDSTLSVQTYSLVQNQQFFGLMAGLNRRFKISNKLLLFVALHYQGSFASLHKYQTQLDSLVVNNTGTFTSTMKLPDLQGKNFYQWQAMIPFGLEMDIYKNQIYIRLEGDAGLIGGKYRPRGYLNSQACGIGLAAIYQFTNRNYSTY